MKYRAEIDGLRALAVVPVILFHAGFELFSGGFVGVDVFFVISGYLITTILIEDIENKRFSIVNFYERRARRILPAFIFVLLISSISFPLILAELSLKDFYKSGFAASLFISNIFFWKESGYFDSAAETKPLLHTWSLAVEEQYYVLFPIFLILAWRFGKNRVFWMIVVMAAISLLLSEWGWRNKATANFYLAPTRAWELFAGSIAAFIVHKRGVQKNNLLALVGVLAIVFSIFFYDEATPFPSIYAVVPVLGVVLLILYADKDTFAAKILSVRIFVGIGLISYSTYLWHQPLLVFFRNHPISLEYWPVFVLIAITGVFGFFSYRYIELPFRNGLKGKKVTYFLFASPFIFALLFLAQNKFVPELIDFGVINDGKANNVFISRVSNSAAAKLLNIKELNEYHRLDIFNYKEKSNCEIILLGDSHAMHLQDGLVNSLQNPRGCRLVGMQSIGCPPLFGYTYAKFGDLIKLNDVDSVQTDCAKINEITENYIRDNANNIERVLVSARWNWLISPVKITPSVEQRILVPSANLKGEFRFSENLTQADRVYNFEKALAKSRSVFESLSLPVYYISQPPLQKLDLRSHSTFEMYDEAKPEYQISFDRNMAVENAFNLVLSSQSKTSKYVSVINLFCSSLQSTCINRIGNRSLYWDENHLSKFGAEYVTEYINKISGKDLVD